MPKRRAPTSAWSRKASKVFCFKMKTFANDEKYSKPLTIQTNNFGTQQTKLGVTQEMEPYQQAFV
jgi:hypothetical protein